jgi:Uma2 family endonuclease
MQALEQDDDEDFYPSSDGRPIAEGDVHLDEMSYLITSLKHRYKDVPDVYVTGNLLLYFRRGDRTARLAPDVFVVKGVPKRMRKSYLLWKEGQAPCFVIEVTSESTRDEDIEMKRDRYERFGVEEYFLHDPLGEYLNPPLQGYRLQDRRYRRIAFEPDDSLISWTTGLRLCREGERLRLVDLATGQPLQNYQEAMEESRRLDAESRRLDEESRRLDEEIRAAEERLTQLRQGS